MLTLMVNLEYVGSLHIFLGPYRGNPIALYLKRAEGGCEIAPRIYPWNDVVGRGETPNRAAADFEVKWKAKGLGSDMYSGPAWEGGIKPERPAPPKPAAAAKPAAPGQAPAPAKGGGTAPSSGQPAAASKPEPVNTPATSTAPTPPANEDTSS